MNKHEKHILTYRVSGDPFETARVVHEGDEYYALRKASELAKEGHTVTVARVVAVVRPSAAVERIES